MEGNPNSQTYETLQGNYTLKFLELVEYGKKDLIVNEAPFNISINDASILVSIEDSTLLFTDKSTCGGDYVNLPLEYEDLLENPGSWDYVECVLIVFNGSLLNPYTMGISSPWIYFTITDYVDSDVVSDDITIYEDGTTTRRQLQTTDTPSGASTGLSECYPFTYIVPSNPNSLQYSPKAHWK